MYYFASKYKKYDDGGNTSGTGATYQGLRAGLGIASNAAGLIDSVSPADSYGVKPMGSTIASSALKGASMGSVAGPWGAAAGAVVGGVAGLISSGSARAAEQRQMAAMRLQQGNAARNRSQAVFAQNPELASGNVGAGYYANGGPLSRNYLSRTQANGGSLSPMSSDAVSINGPSHEQGGVQLPDNNAEVEGGETMQGNFVFSDRLGFADEHKRLARAIGTIEEKKVMTPERVDALTRMKDREQKLALSQEYMKHTMAHFGQPVE